MTEMNDFRWGRHDLGRCWFPDGREGWSAEDAVRAVTDTQDPRRYLDRMNAGDTYYLTRPQLLALLERIDTVKAYALSKWIRNLPSEALLKAVEEVLAK